MLRHQVFRKFRIPPVKQSVVNGLQIHQANLRFLSTSPQPPPPSDMQRLYELAEDISNNLATGFDFSKGYIFNTFGPAAQQRMKSLANDLLEKKTMDDLLSKRAGKPSPPLSYENAIKVSIITGTMKNTLLYMKEELVELEVKGSAVLNLEKGINAMNDILNERMQELSEEALAAPIDPTISSRGMMIPVMASLAVLVPVIDVKEDGSPKLAAFLEANSVGSKIGQVIDGSGSRSLFLDDSTSPSHSILESHISSEKIRKMYAKHRHFSISFLQPVHNTVNTSPKGESELSNVAQGTGVLQIGATTDSIMQLQEDTLSFVPVVANNSNKRYHWVTEVCSVVVGDKDVPLGRPIRVAWDPSIPISLMSPDIANEVGRAYVAETEGKSFPAVSGDEITNANHPGLVPMGIRMVQGGTAFTSKFSIDYSFKPFVMLTNVLPEEERKIVSDCDIILGLNFLSHFAIVFDENNSKVGIGKVQSV